MSSQDKNLPYEILTLSHLGFKYCSVHARARVPTTTHTSSLVIKMVQMSMIQKGHNIIIYSRADSNGVSMVSTWV